MTKIVLSEEKLRVLGPDIDVEDVRRGLLAIVEVCGDRGKFGSVPLMSRRQRFDWLVAPKSALIQTSAVHSGFSIGLKETLDHLCARYLNLEQGLG